MSLCAVGRTRRAFVQVFFDRLSHGAQGQKPRTDLAGVPCDVERTKPCVCVPCDSQAKSMKSVVQIVKEILVQSHFTDDSMLRSLVQIQVL